MFSWRFQKKCLTALLSSLRTKRAGLSGRPPCKGVAIGVARRGGRLGGERTLRVPPSCSFPVSHSGGPHVRQWRFGGDAAIEGNAPWHTQGGAFLLEKRSAVLVACRSAYRTHTARRTGETMARVYWHCSSWWSLTWSPWLGRAAEPQPHSRTGCKIKSVPLYCMPVCACARKTGFRCLSC